MSNVTNHVFCDTEDCISLYDIWHKLVQYKKIFWLIFVTTFVIGASIVLLQPAKYEFSQTFMIGRYANTQEQGSQMMDSSVVITRIKSVYLDAALHKYNLQSKIKVNPKNCKIEIKDAGGGVFVLSTMSTEVTEDMYRFIFKAIVNSLYEDTREEIEFRIRNFSVLKKNLETRLQEINSFYKQMLKKGFDYAANINSKDVATLERRIISMYLNDQQGIAINLVNNINSLQAKINGTFEVKLISDFMVSDFAVGVSKCLLLFLMGIAALFFAFLGAFIVDFVVKLRTSSGVVKS